MIANAAVGFAGGGIGTIIVIGAIFCIYMIPTILAYNRKVTNVGSVFVINFFLGWTFVGWIVALAMAVRSTIPVVGLNQVTVVTGSGVGEGDMSRPSSQQPNSFYAPGVALADVGKTCLRCRDPLTQGAKFCIVCGEPVPIAEKTASTSNPDGDRTVTCSSCGKKLAEAAKFCPECGTAAAPVASTACSACGHPMEEGDRFCMECGHSTNMIT